MTRSRNELGRRQALQRIGALGVGAVVSACGGGNGGGPAADTATATPSATGTPPATPSASATRPPATAVPTATVTAPDTPTATAVPSDTAAPTPSPTPTATPTATPEQIDCVLSPRQIQGPYFIDVGLARGDIREDRQGVPLALALRVVDAGGCTPIRDAVVNVWHADAAGVYSGFAGQPGGVDATGETFLRGFQVTDAGGRVQFATIYPGWYPGRTVHIHVRIHLDATTVLVTQLYFPEPVTDAVHALAPYAERGHRDTTNAADAYFAAGLILAVAAGGDGYAASFTLGVAR